MRDPHSIVSKSALQQKRADSDTSKDTTQNSDFRHETSTAPMSDSEPPPLLRSTRNLRPTKKYVNDRSNLTERSHPSINQLNANITKLVSDPEIHIQINKTDNTPQCLLLQKKMTKVEDRKTWVLSTPEKRAKMITNALKSKYTFRLQCFVDGTWKYKVRLLLTATAKSLVTTSMETFAPTAKFKSICIVLNLAAIYY
jgi:hypothetical protein